MTAKSVKSITIPVGELEAIVGWAHDNWEHRLHVVAFRFDECVAACAARLIRVPMKTFGHSFGVSRRDLMAAVDAANGYKMAYQSVTGAGCGVVSIIITPIDKSVVMLEIDLDVGGSGAKLAVPRRDLSGHGYPSLATLDRTMDTSKASVHPLAATGYKLDPAFLSAVASTNMAFGVGHNTIQIEGWTSDRTGAIVFTNARNVRFVVMPHAP